MTQANSPTTVAFDKWASFYLKAIDYGTDLIWPNEPLIFILKGNYIPGLQKNYHGKSVLDVGCGTGNNLVFLAQLGLSVSGTEVKKDICDVVRAKLERFGYKADLREGTNRQLPFPDNTFDFLGSLDVIHYEDNESDMRKAIREYHRVLKPSGRFFISTTGPEHKILKGSTSLGNHRYQIGRPDDLRKGQTFFYFDTPDSINQFFGEVFSDVLVGRVHHTLFTEIQDS